MTGKNFETELRGCWDQTTSSVTKSKIFSLTSFIMRLRPSDTETLLRNCPISWKTTQIVVIFLQYKLEQIICVNRNILCTAIIFPGPGSGQKTGAEESSLRVTRDYSSNNFRQLGVRRCKNAPALVSSDKWPGVGAGPGQRSSSARQSRPSLVISCRSWAKAVLSQQDEPSVRRHQILVHITDRPSVSYLTPQPRTPPLLRGGIFNRRVMRNWREVKNWSKIVDWFEHLNIMRCELTFEQTKLSLFTENLHNYKVLWKVTRNCYNKSWHFQLIYGRTMAAWITNRRWIKNALKMSAMSS